VCTNGERSLQVASLCVLHQAVPGYPEKDENRQSSQLCASHGFAGLVILGISKDQNSEHCPEDLGLGKSHLPGAPLSSLLTASHLLTHLVFM
jgi:hypothetical protein